MRQGDQTKNRNVKRDLFKTEVNLMRSKDHRINKNKSAGMLHFAGPGILK